MGEFHFYYPRRKLDPMLTRRAFIARRLRAPVASEAFVEHISQTRDLLVLRVNSEEPGILYVPFVDPHGCVYFASTETLSCSTRPRPLFLELARGQLSRLTNRGAEWIGRGFLPHPKLRKAAREQVRKFAELLTCDREDSKFDANSVRLFESLCDLSRKINEEYLTRVLAARGEKSPPWVTRFGFSAPVNSTWSELYDSVFEPKRSGIARRSLGRIFQTVNPDFCWLDIERSKDVFDWTPFDTVMRDATDRNLRTTIGPLIRWGETLPAFLNDGDESQTRELFKKYVAELLKRDRKRTKRWIVATNVEARVKGISLESRLALTAQVAFEIHRFNPKAQTFLGFEQPFGDSIRRGARDMTPLELAMRVNKRGIFDGFYLEVNFGLSTNSTYPRDPMELHRFFDRWSALGTPVCLGLSCPGPTKTKTKSKSNDSEESTVLVDMYRQRASKRSLFGRKPDPVDAENDLLVDSPDETDEEALLWNEDTQRETTVRFLVAALSHRNVDEVVWTKFADVNALKYSTDQEFGDNQNGEKSPFVKDSSETGEIALDSDDEQGFELEGEVDSKERYNPRDRNRLPLSGLIDEKSKPKSTLDKLAGLRRAYID